MGDSRKELRPDSTAVGAGLTALGTGADLAGPGPDAGLPVPPSADRPGGAVATTVNGAPLSLPEVLRSQRVYEGKVVSLWVDEIALPGGRRATREVVEHPGAVVVIALDENGRVALVRQYRHAVKKYLLEFPAGGLEPGEAPLATAQRELREEVGLEAAKWTALGSFFSSPGFANEMLHAFLAEDLRPGFAPPDEDEDIAVVRYNLCELFEHPTLLEDAKSLAALLLLRNLAGVREPAERAGD
jgi:ADP-ribose pyrophosphatase